MKHFALFFFGGGGGGGGVSVSEGILEGSKGCVSGIACHYPHF